VLTIDPRLQRTAEELLDGALARRRVETGCADPAGGGAVVVMDVQSGEIMAAATAPRFDPGLFAAGDSARRETLLHDPAHPLFDRVIQMALPPGSVFKTLTAIALLEAGGLDPDRTFNCRGYLQRPDRLRCAIFVRHGVGHGDVTLSDALAQSCNVYFFHHAGDLAPAALCDWAGRFGFGQPTGIDLPGESAATLPSPENIRRLEGHAWRIGDSQGMAIGQGSLTATPLQVLRLMAAVANGGRLVVPRLLKDVKTSPRPLAGEGPGAKASSDDDPPCPTAPPPTVAGLRPSTLATVREGLRRVVADPKGTAHGPVYLDSISIAGKTGTASVADDQVEHAWLAGYVPADEPRYALVVVLEHAGDAAPAAGPVVKRLVLRMQELGLLD
jgi:penicillin-binding protein 2